MNISDGIGYDHSALLVKSLIACLAVLAQLACSQVQPCTLSLEQSPELRGFRLGMSLEQIQARFKDFPNPPANEFGLAKVILDRAVKDEIRKDTGVTFLNATRYAELNDVDRMYLSIVDGNVAEIEVYYKNDLKWRSVDEFVTKTAQALKLNGDWKASTEDTRSLGCEGFIVRAGIKRDYLRSDRDEKLPFVFLTDYMKSNKPMLREMNKNDNVNRQEQNKRDTFKP